MSDIRTSALGGIPFGNNAARPQTPQIGQPYFNGQENRLELYTQGVGWQNIVAETPGVINYTGNVNQTDSSHTIIINGTNFTTGAEVVVIGTDGVEVAATSAVVNSIVQITATLPALSPSYEPYDIKVTNPSNLFGLLPDVIYVNDTPVWQTSAGSLGTVYESEQFSSTLSATDDELSALTYSLFSGTLPSGISLNSSTGVISGTAPSVSTNTTYNFTIQASDGSNTSNRAFSLIVANKVFPIVEMLLVAGGGSGANGNGNSGGGGGGAVVSVSAFQAAASSYNLSVGLGGAKNSPANDLSGNRGGNTVFGPITALGGGGGLGWGGSRTNVDSAGSGGGGGQSQNGGTTIQSSQNAGIQNIVQYGNAGGNSGAWPTYGGGGGGGAGAAGGNSTTSVCGSGGGGISSSITGIATYYGGGGGGGAENDGGPVTAGSGGVGGGGAGRARNQGTLDGENGTDGLGGGGGNGGWTSSGGRPGGKGGDGVFIMAIPNQSQYLYPSVSAGLTYTIDTTARSGYKVYKFTAGSGTVTFANV